MATSIATRFKNAWNRFAQQNDVEQDFQANAWSMNSSFGFRPDRTRLRLSNERSIISSIYTRLAIDVASVNLLHIKKDENGRFREVVPSGLNNCLTVEANIDQAGREFRQDMAMSLFDKGVIAVVPVDTNVDPTQSGSFEIQTMRVGEVLHWYPRHVRVSLYNDRTGNREELTLPKDSVAIITNPLYSVMNETNSTLQRLIRKLNLLDSVDEQASSGKLDLIIQLPYVIKSEARRQQAEQRRKDIEVQLKGSQYGIAYTDGTEKITQLNRPAENNLLKQVEYLTAMLYGQLGLTESVFDGSADEQTMLNYYNRTIEPVLSAIKEGLDRTFLTKTARTQGQAIEFFRDPFKLVPVGALAEIADKFTRNEILSSNEVRGIIGYRPHADPKAEQLINKNLPQPEDSPAPTEPI